jgi:3-oxoacyl-[acyl-carrier-protein] synthase-3
VAKEYIVAAPRSRFDNIAISGLAHVDAGVVVSSSELEDQITDTMERLQMPPGLLEGLTGIENRRFWDVGIAPSDAAALAAEKVLAQVDVEVSSIGALINTSVSRDYLEPSTAAIVQGKIGLGRECINFDIGSACLGFLQGASVAASMIDRGEIDHALIVAGEDGRPIVENTIRNLQDPETDDLSFREQFACLTLGSAGVAMVISRAEPDDGLPRFLGGLSVSATQHHALSVGNYEGGRTDSQALLIGGLECAEEGWAEAAAAFDWNVADVDLFAIHQVSKVHTDMLVDLLKFEPERVPKIYPQYGNTGPASVPTVLSKEVDAGRVTSGDQIMLVGMGSGINAAAFEVRW